MHLHFDGLCNYRQWLLQGRENKEHGGGGRQEGGTHSLFTDDKRDSAVPPGWQGEGPPLGSCCQRISETSQHFNIGINPTRREGFGPKSTCELHGRVGSQSRTPQSLVQLFKHSSLLAFENWATVFHVWVHRAFWESPLKM